MAILILVLILVLVVIIIFHTTIMNRIRRLSLCAKFVKASYGAYICKTCIFISTMTIFTNDEALRRVYIEKVLESIAHIIMYIIYYTTLSMPWMLSFI